MSEREYEALTLEQVDTILADPKCVGVKEGDDGFPVGRLLLLSAFVGEDDERLQIATGMPIQQIFSITATLHKNGVFGKWIDHYHDYFEDEHSGIILNCDMACGQDMLERSLIDGQAHWKMIEAGLKYVEEKLLPRLKKEGKKWPTKTRK